MDTEETDFLDCFVFLGNKQQVRIHPSLCPQSIWNINRINFFFSECFSLLFYFLHEMSEAIKKKRSWNSSLLARANFTHATVTWLGLILSLLPNIPDSHLNSAKKYYSVCIGQSMLLVHLLCYTCLTMTEALNCCSWKACQHCGTQNLSYKVIMQNAKQ